MDKWLTHPTALKIISVILGVLLFAVVHIDPETAPQVATTSIETKVIEAATIQTTGLDEEKYVLTAMEPTVARIVVEGGISSLYAASPEDYVVSVDLSRAKPGLQELPLTLKLPKGIKEVNLEPRKVTVQIEEIVKKTFDAQVITEGDPAEGHVVGTPEILSENGGVVQVTLPKEDMDKVGLVAVHIDVAGADKTVTNKKAKVIVYDTDGQEMPNAIVEPSTLHVEVKVTLPFKQVPLQIRYTGTLSEDLSLVSVKPDVDQVTVYAPQNELDTISVYDGAVLDLSKVKQSGVMKVKATPVDGIQDVNPGEIELEIVVESTATRTMSNVPISIVGGAENVTAQLVTPASGTIDLTINGAQSVLDEVTIADLAVIANIAGLGPGSHEVPLELELPPYVQPVLTDGQALTATVTITAGTAQSGEDAGADQEVGVTPTSPPGDTGSEGEGQEAANDRNEGDGTTGADASGSGNGNAVTDETGLGEKQLAAQWEIKNATLT
ncbi:hypothetical protein D3P08_26510 [Paenibacillus nanensis]|uniref:YbbR-like domain-containing protein n=1 Tax=Paenibacillus nanensis TaxID=393251 RepID=A0A3A1UHH4_9BACL|nr:CdaR family protein [Paenibacillus nanensis]RIX46021.1 hypothetical protein D3P08_26510 [Paenibacillus nanensis]